MKPGWVLIFFNCSSLTSIDLMMSPSILSSDQETRTGKQNRKEVLRRSALSFRTRHTELHAEDPDIYASTFHGEIPRQALGMTIREASAQLRSLCFSFHRDACEANGHLAR